MPVTILRRFLGVGAAFLLACLTLHAQNAPRQIGVVSKVLQPAHIERSAEEIIAVDKAPIFARDALTTGSGGRIRAALGDGSIVNLGTESKLMIARHDPRAQQTTLELLYGRLRAQIVHFAVPGARFDIRTNKAWIEGAGDVSVDASNPVATTVVSHSDGEITVHTGADHNKFIRLKAGESVAVRFDSLESRPATPQEMAAMTQDFDSNSGAPAPQPGGAYRMGSGVSPPRIVSKVEPEYTKAARDKKIEGTVVLSAVVGDDGRVRDMRVVRSLDPDLEEKALEAVRQWEFSPGTKNGKPVPVICNIEVTFRL